MRIKVETANHKINIEIDLNEVKESIKPQSLSNDSVLKYIEEQIKSVNLRDAIFTNLDSGQSGTKGFLAAQIEKHINI